MTFADDELEMDPVANQRWKLSLYQKAFNAGVRYNGTTSIMANSLVSGRIEFKKGDSSLEFVSFERGDIMVQHSSLDREYWIRRKTPAVIKKALVEGKSF